MVKTCNDLASDGLDLSLRLVFQSELTDVAWMEVRIKQEVRSTTPKFLGDHEPP